MSKSFDRCYAPKFGGGHSLKRYASTHTQDMFIKSYVKPHSNKQIEII